jgi:hypothetical protein
VQLLQRVNFSHHEMSNLDWVRQHSQIKKPQKPHGQGHTYEMDLTSNKLAITITVIFRSPLNHHNYSEWIESLEMYKSYTFLLLTTDIDLQECTIWSFIF